MLHYFLLALLAVYTSVDAAEKNKNSKPRARQPDWADPTSTAGVPQVPRLRRDSCQRGYAPHMRQHRGPVAAPDQVAEGISLFEAAERGDLARIRVFIKAGAYLDVIDLGDNRDCYTPLMKAIAADHTQVALALIEANADVNFVSSNTAIPFDGNTPLILAAYAGNLPVVEALLAKRAVVKYKTTSGYTAIMFATYKSEFFGQPFTNIVKALEAAEAHEEAAYSGAGASAGDGTGVFARHGAGENYEATDDTDSDDSPEGRPHQARSPITRKESSFWLE